MRCPARRWNILAWPGLIPRWRSCTCAWVQARVAARSKAVVSRCLSMRSSSASRDDATTVQKAMCTIAPGAIRTRRRRAKTASSTVPTVFESGRPSIAAIAVRTLRLRPRNRALSVSTSAFPTAPLSTTARCAAQISGSLGARRLRVAKMAPTSARYSVSTNSLEKAGCVTSTAWGASTSSA